MPIYLARNSKGELKRMNVTSPVDPSRYLDAEDGDVLVGTLPAPIDSYFREAWVYENGQLDIDLPKAREVKVAEIRIKRDELLAKTDAKYVELLSKGEDVTAVQADKAALRDLPSDAAVDLEALIVGPDIQAYDPFASLSLNLEY